MDYNSDSKSTWGVVHLIGCSFLETVWKNRIDLDHGMAGQSYCNKTKIKMEDGPNLRSKFMRMFQPISGEYFSDLGPKLMPKLVYSSQRKRGISPWSMSNQGWVVDVWTPVVFCVRLPSSFLAMLLCGDCHAKLLLAALALLHSIEVGLGRRSDVERISAGGSLHEEHADVTSQSLSKSDPPDPFAGFNLYGPWTAENTGCTKTGWKGKYTIFNGQMDMLTVDVGSSSTTFALQSWPCGSGHLEEFFGMFLLVFAGAPIRGTGENVYFWKHVDYDVRCWVGVGGMFTFLALAHMLDATQDAGLGGVGCV